MGKYLAVLKIDDEELKSIFEDLKDAEEKIWSCYGRLKELGVIEVCQKRNRQRQLTAFHVKVSPIHLQMLSKRS